MLFSNDSKESVRSISCDSTFEYLDFRFSMWAFANEYSAEFCRIGIFKRITRIWVSAHKVEVTAESIPPETPTTKPDRFEDSQYDLNQSTICLLTFSKIN